MNKVIILGTIVRDIEMRYTQTNLAIARFTLAVRRDIKNKEGNYESDFISCLAYGKTGETIGKYFKKGSHILVEGHIQTGSFENSKHEKKYTTDVIVENINFVDKFEKKETNPYEEMGKQVQMDTIQNESGTSFEMPF